MNLLEILNSNKNIAIITEAIKINTPEEAYELIKNKQIGVKVEPSWVQLLNSKLIKSDKDRILKFLEKVINITGKDATFAIQLVANKVPINDFISNMNFDSLKEIIACKNKPWAKEIPGYKEVIQLNGKKYDSKEWHKLEKALQEEGQKHGKHNKGSGDVGDVINVYDDGTWTLQIPKSWDGEKAAAFYGKRNEKQIPTKWCTRTNISYYNEYTENNTKPLYIIRNWETGKSYQMAIRGNRIDFLDQDDVKGDKIAKGDFSEIPDELLKKIHYGNKENMLDFKKEVSNAQNEIDDYKKEKRKRISKPEKEKLEKRGYFKDISKNPASARWGKTEKVNDEISKNVFLNFAEKAANPELINPLDKEGFTSSYLPGSIKELSSKSKRWNSKMIKGKKMVYGKYTKHDGSYAVKYYFNNNPNCFILMTLKNDDNVRSKELGKRSYPLVGGVSSSKPELATNYEARYYVYNENNDTWKETNLNGLMKNEPRAYELYHAADNDFGNNKTSQRYINNHDDNYASSSDMKFLELSLTKSVTKHIHNILNNDSYNIEVDFKEEPRLNTGGILPRRFRVYVDDDGKKIFTADFYMDRKSKYVCEVIEDHSSIKNIENVLNTISKKIIVDYSKEAVKNKRLRYLRTINRSSKNSSNRLQFEEFNYFPY